MFSNFFVFQHQGRPLGSCFTTWPVRNCAMISNNFLLAISVKGLYTSKMVHSSQKVWAFYAGNMKTLVSETNTYQNIFSAADTFLLKHIKYSIHFFLLLKLETDNVHAWNFETPSQMFGVEIEIKFNWLCPTSRYLFPYALRWKES